MFLAATCALTFGEHVRMPGDPKYYLNLARIEVAEGTIFPDFQPEVKEYTLDVTQGSATNLTMYINVDLMHYDPMFCPRIAVNGETLHYTPLEPIKHIINIGGSIAPVKKDVQIQVSDPSGHRGGFMGLGGVRSETYLLHVVKPPQEQRLVMASTIRLTDSTGKAIMAQPAFVANSPMASNLRFHVGFDIEEAKLTVGCHNVPGVSWELDGKPQSGYGGTLHLSMSRHYTRRLVFTCVYSDPEWAAVPVQRSYLLKVLKHVPQHDAGDDKERILKLASAQLRVIPTHGFCAPAPSSSEDLAEPGVSPGAGEKEVVSETGFICKINQETAMLVATFSSVDGAAPEVSLISDSMNEATVLHNAIPSTVHVQHGRMHSRLVMEVGDEAIVYPVLLLRPDDCSSVVCKQGRVVRPRDPFAAETSMCAREVCSDDDEPHCCVDKAKCDTYSAGCPAGFGLRDDAAQALCAEGVCALTDQGMCCEVLHATFTATTTQAATSMIATTTVPPATTAAPPPPTTTTTIVRTTAGGGWVPTTITTTSTAMQLLCAEQDKVWLPLDMLGTQPTIEDSFRSCQERCLSTPKCEHFSFWTAHQHCHLQDGRADRQEFGYGFMSGPPECTPGNLVPTTTTTYTLPPNEVCFQHGIYWGPLIGGLLYFDAPKEEGILACQVRCAEWSACSHFQYDTKAHECALADAASLPNPGAPDYVVSGPPTCHGLYNELSDYVLLQYRMAKAADILRESRMARSPTAADVRPIAGFGTLACLAVFAIGLFLVQRRRPMLSTGSASEMRLIPAEPLADRGGQTVE